MKIIKLNIELPEKKIAFIKMMAEFKIVDGINLVCSAYIYIELARPCIPVAIYNELATGMQCLHFYRISSPLYISGYI